jgi:hypothetical protein
MDIGLTIHKTDEPKIRIVEMRDDPISGCVVLEKGRIDFFPDEIMTDVVKVLVIPSRKNISMVELSNPMAASAMRGHSQIHKVPEPT